MEIRYKSDANHNYMIVKRGGDVRTNQEKMVIRNSIKGLLKMNLHFVNESAFYYYEIQSRQSLSRLFEGRKMSFEDLCSFLYGMVRVFKELEAYLLPTEGIILDPEAIYVDMESCNPEFAFYPASSIGNVQEGFLSLSEFLTEHIDNDDCRSVQLAYDYYMSVSDGVYSPEGILKTRSVTSNMADPEKEKCTPEDLIPSAGETKDEGTEFDYWETEEDMSELDYFMKDEKKNGEEKGSLKVAFISLGLILAAAVIYLVLVLNPSILSFPELSEKEYIISGCVIALLFGAALTAVIFFYNRQRIRESENAEAEKKKRLEKRVDDPLSANEIEEYGSFSQKETVSDADDDRTTLLCSSGSRSFPLLSGKEFGKDICFTIDKDPFVLGKKRDKADGVIEDRSVSRIHASISEKNGRYFLSDMNSTNGTYLNGRRLELNETVGLEDGDTLGLADVFLKFSSGHATPGLRPVRSC